MIVEEGALRHEDAGLTGHQPIGVPSLRERSHGAHAVNGFVVNAIGWILAFNARILSEEERPVLLGLWTQLQHAHAEDKRRCDWLTRLMLSRSIRLSEKSAGAFAALVHRMTELHPERFGYHALRKRRQAWLLQTGLGFLCCFGAASWLPISSPLLEEIVLTLFLMSLAWIIPTTMLWRAAAAVKRLGGTDRSVGP